MMSLLHSFFWLMRSFFSVSVGRATTTNRPEGLKLAVEEYAGEGCDEEKYSLLCLRLTKFLTGRATATNGSRPGMEDYMRVGVTKNTNIFSPNLPLLCADNIFVQYPRGGTTTTTMEPWGG
jgi:hypothetical protein